jgi:lantibiotic modifying enzyme
MTIVDIAFADMDRKLITSLLESPLGLANGKMGFCLYFYLLSKVEQNKEYNTIAGKLLSEV